MCGIAGYLPQHNEPAAEMRDNVVAMCNRIAKRGPDDSGVWIDHTGGAALGHRRLAVVDLSANGHQPMISPCERYVLVFNGEIYNHLELRRTLEPHSWKGHADTETVLALFARHGIEETLPKLVGMFALAVWDRQRQQLTLARDRLGEKPLYFGTMPSGEFAFGSELKALCGHSKWRGQVDRDALSLLLRHNYIPAPYSIYQGISKLLPGHWLRVCRSGEIREGTYWCLTDIATQMIETRDNTVRSDSEAIDELESRLSCSIRGQLVADVPLGAFLSGGVDSSLIVALMAKYNDTPVRTFSIGFHDEEFDEAKHAKAVARHLKTEHTEHYVSAAEALSIAERVPSIYDEPFADSSQIPTLLVSAMARRHVTVALSGDGGDELFAGYSRYGQAIRLWRGIGHVPLCCRRWAARGLQRVSAQRWSRLGALPLRLAGKEELCATFGDKLHKFADGVLVAPDEPGMYRSLVSNWQHPDTIVLGAHEPATALSRRDIHQHFSDSAERMAITDQLSYLPDDILAKVDRASMSVSLETRVPMLDHRVVEYAWGLPMHQKVRDGQSKWVLRQLLYRHVPRQLIERPKQGFAVPLAAWLRGPLREWAENLLAPQRLNTEGYLDAQRIRQCWEEHVDGRRNWHHQLWSVLMFEGWLEANVR